MTATNRHYLKEIVLVVLACLYSTPYLRVGACFAVVAALVLVARSPRFKDPYMLILFVPLTLGAVSSVLWGSAPGPTAEAIGMLVGAWAFFVLGVY